MTVRLARTNAEAHIYMDLQPCENCGTSDFTPRSSVVVLDDGDLGSRYSGACGSCGAERTFTFRIPQQALPQRADGVRYGDDRPSELLDPGDWLWVADRASGQGPADAHGLAVEERKRQRYFLGIAVAAVQEVMKFIPPGADGVPDDAFFTADGRAVRDAEPGRFRRIRLQAVLEAYQGMYAEFGR